MLTLSLWQPWASLFLFTDPDEKRFETRHWPTHQRGWVLIHAAKNRGPEVRDMLGARLVQERFAAHGLNVCDIPFGALIGSVNLVNCKRMSELPEPSEREQAFGNWESERYAWERGPETRIFSRPIPYSGKQGFFHVSWDVVAHELTQPITKAPQEVLF